MKFRTPLTPLAIVIAATFACAPADDGGESPPTGGAAVEASAPEPGVVNVVARGLSFDLPDTVAPGWTTFRLINESPMVHFAIVEKMPDGIGVAEQQAEVAPPFQNGMNAIVAGDMDAAMAAFGELPEWFGEVQFLGGPGLTGAGVTSEATMRLEPGTYLLECYVKTGEVFHSFNPDPAVVAMVAEFTVAGEPTGVSEPQADHEIVISSESGFALTGTPAAGSNTFRVSFADQATYANFVGHDVHVVRLEEGVSADEVGAWMNWSAPGGLNTPAPASFVGGLNDMGPGGVGYFTVTLEPGSYALVAEVPDPAEKGMFVPFAVPESM
jgi:hypothetical protein